MNAKKIVLIIISIVSFTSVLFLFASDATASTIGNWYKDPFAIRDFVKSKGYNIPSLYIGQAAMNFDEATALKICQLAGFNAVESKSCTYDPRCGWTSCGDNYMAKWNSSINNFDIINACSAGNKWISSLVCKNNCVSHYSKACSNGSVYWYDSCGVKEDLYQGCSANQICQNAQCVNVACSSSSDCGTSGYIGDAFCKYGNVYRPYKTYICYSPGTVNSSCSSATSDMLVEICSSGKVCSNGSCQTIACSSDAQCGTSGYIGDAFCQNGDVYKQYKTYTCNNPGTASSSCSNSTSNKLFTDCSSNQICSGGACVNQTITCSSSSDCGTSGYIGDAFCSGGDVYKTYKTYTCSNPGTSASACSSSTQDKLITNCLSTQTCSNGSCQTIACSSDAQCGASGYIGDAFCQNGDVYKQYKTYTCNNPGTASSSCSNSTSNQLLIDCASNQTCSNGTCQTIACSSDAQCGTSGYIGDAFCQNGDVYKTYRTYTCNNPGTASSVCSNSTSNKLITNCTSNQTCSGGACVNQTIACSSSSDCGTSGYIGDAFCSGGDVYKTYKTYTCSNPGTSASACSSSTQDKLLTDCSSNQTCSGGACVNQTIACSSDAQCGTSGYIGDAFCSGGDVYKAYRTYACSNPGTASSYCSSSTQDKLLTDCSSNQICSGGACVNQTIACSSDAQCGTSGYIGDAFCQNGDVYKTYRTYTCSDPGTVSSACSSSTQDKLLTDCSSNQTCSNGTCSSSCTNHSYKQCDGNYLYWYNSCGNREEVFEYCQYGCSNNSCNYYNTNISVQTNSANILSNNQATLNGYIYYNNYNNSTYNNNAQVWFQWGTSTGYGNETTHQTMNNTGSFNQTINLYSSNTTYHYRAVAQTSGGNTVYGQDMTFNSATTSNTLNITQQVRNLSSGYSGFSSSVSAKPLDTVMYMITIQSNGSQEANNVYIKDILPSNLIYKNNQIVSGTNDYSGDIANGINLGTITPYQTITITYQAQIASSANFAYGTTTLTGNISVTGSNLNYNPVTSASVFVTRTAVYGVSSISTGLTNNFFTDSFLLPLMIALTGIWILKSGLFFGIEKWIDVKKRARKNYKSGRELSSRIAQIQKAENI